MSIEVEINKEQINLPYRYAREHGVILDKLENKIVFIKANSSPSLQVFSELRNFYNLSISVDVLSDDDFEKELAKYYADSAISSSEIVEDLDFSYSLSDLAANLPRTADLLDSENDAPVIKLINAVIAEAIKSKASDIHIEPYEEHISIRFRIDGVLREVLKPNSKLVSMLNARIKIMSSLDIAEKRIPQDGRMSLKLGEKWIDIRVSTLPSSYGERIVLRILDKSDAQLNLTQLGMSDELLELFKTTLKNPNGIILVTGPTGSGKTTSLYAGINLLNDNTKNILTVEDPVEYAIDGVSQTQVNTKVDMTFSKGLRAILRQDPDIVMVGEIRDVETAEIAIQASLTGHLVLSTVHTNDSVAAITRMKDMGIEPYLLGSSVKAIMAQRLLRTLCIHCKEEYSLDNFVQNIPKKSMLYKAKGCKECGETGYVGRTGIFELLIVDEEIKKAITENMGEQEIGKIAFKKNFKLSQSGEKLVLSGTTSLEELLRVIKEE